MKHMNDPRALNPYLPKGPADYRWRPGEGGTSLCAFARGRPAPQGSKNYFARGAKESSPHLPAWRSDVVRAVTLATGSVPGLAPMWEFHGPVCVTLDFALQRPKSEPKNKPTRAHLGKPDVDKLARGVLDALTTAGVLRDDSIVVELRAGKRYAELGEPTGCHIAIEPCTLQ